MSESDEAAKLRLSLRLAYSQAASISPKSIVLDRRAANEPKLKFRYLDRLSLRRRLCREGRHLFFWLSELNYVTRRVFTNNLFAADAIQNIVSEFHTISLEH